MDKYSVLKIQWLFIFQTRLDRFTTYYSILDVGLDFQASI
jgi:hypothetical protein